MGAYEKQIAANRRLLGPCQEKITLRRQLLSVQQAILAIESGAQEYQIGNRRITKADLLTLYNREASLKAAIAAEEAGGMCIAYAETGTN